MEIYIQKKNVVTFQPPTGATNVTAKATFKEQTVDLTITEDAVVSATLPYISEEGDVKVEWSFTIDTFGGSDTVTITDTYEAVTPILSEQEIKAIHPNATDEEIVKIEAATRHVVNAYTGQTFGVSRKSVPVRGRGGRYLILPLRLLELNSINGAVDKSAEILNDGRLIARYAYGVPPVKADYYGLHVHVGGVIHNPNSVKLHEFSRKTYDIDGLWGWREVPQQVKEAAKLLVNDYACGEQAYRDRYIESMTAADWRVQYHNLAYQGTGNVRADQLLDGFVVKYAWVII